MTPRVHVGIDTGGTFTDFLVVCDGEALLFKVPSTPDDPARAFHQGLAIAARRLLARGIDVAATRPWDVAHGFTVATNALLARAGARVALVATEGFEDMLEIGRQDRPDLYALEPRRPPSLVAAGARFGLAERVAAGGKILHAPSAAALGRLVRRLRAARPEAIAVCLLHSYAAPGHERRAGRALARALPGVPISLSSEVARVHREVERGSTATVNAYVAPLVTRYLGRLEDRARQRLRIMQSNGGSAPAARMARYPVQTVLSGPAGGVLGAFRLGQASGVTSLLTLDVGGTSTDVALVPGRLLATRESEIAGVPIAIPILDVHTVGAGGGSIASLDAGGALAVGPQSAGAVPGPACYGGGGPATVTDANVVLGRIVPELFLDGELALDARAARTALERFGRRMGASAEAAACGVLSVANATIERALRRISVERGHDVRQSTLVAFGGAGALHACELADALGMAEVLVPPAAGVLSAWGLLGAEERHDATRTLLWRLAPAARWPLAAARGALGVLRRELERAHGVAVRPRFDALWRVRYLGQSFELDVLAGSLGQSGAGARAAADPRAAFHRAHELRFGYARPSEAVEIVQLDVALCRPGPVLPPSRPPARTARDARLETRSLVTAAARAPARAPARAGVWRRERLGKDAHVTGPALVIEYGATTYVPPGWRLAVDARANLRLARIRARRGVR